MNIYKPILHGLQTQTAEIPFQGVLPDQIVAAFRQILREHPELFWVKTGCDWTEVYRGEELIEVKFRPRYYRTAAENKKKAQAVENAVHHVLSGMRPGMSDWDKALFLHDWIVNNTDYHTTAARVPDEALWSSGYIDSYNVCGVLLDHRAVCAGYAQAFQLLAQRAGLECLRVEGSGRGEGLHEWNIIRLNGRYYHVDVTWDDPVFEGAEKSVCHHDHFCVSTREISLTHSIRPGQALPACTDDAMSFYHRRGLYFPLYDYSSVAKVITAYAVVGSVELKFGSRTEVEKAKNDLIAQHQFFRTRGISGKYRHVSYSVSSSGLVLALEWP